MKQYTFRTIFQKDDQGFHGFVPALPGCHSYGDTIEEARKNIKEAVIGWIQANQELGWEIPQDEGIETIESVEVKVDSSKDRFTYA